MSIFNDLLGSIGGTPDIENLATKVGLSPDMAEKAVAALGMAHTEPGDTVEGAAEKTGLDSSVLSQVVEHIGGEGALGQFAQVISENPQAQGMFGGLAGKLFGNS